MADDALGLYAVSDGMGDGALGEEASRLTIELVAAAVADQEARLALVRAGAAQPAKIESMLRKAVLDACAAVYERACGDPELAGMGASLTMLAVAGGYGVVAHVGHSRIYLVRDGKLNQLSNDHTFAAELGEERGVFEIEDEQTSNALSRALGMQPSVSVDTLVIELLPGDRILLCSDGYSRYLQDEEALVRQLTVAGKPEQLARQLVESANVAGGEDNVTCVVVALDSDQPDERRSSAILERYNLLSHVFLFEDLELPLLARVLSHSKLPRHQPDEWVVEQDQRCDQLMVVLEGRYTLLRDGVEVGALGVGDHAGATLLFHPRPARASIRASSEGRMLQLSGPGLRRLLRARPWLGMGLLQKLGAQLSADLDRSYEQREGSLERTLDGEQL